MVKIRYAGELVELVEFFTGGGFGLGDLFDHYDSLVRLIGEAGDFALVADSAVQATWGSPGFSAVFAKSGPDLLTVTDLELGEVVLEIDATATGLDIRSGDQLLRLAGTLPDSYAEVLDLWQALTAEDPDIGAILGGLSLTGAQLLEAQSGGGWSTFADLQLRPDGLTLTVLGLLLEVSAPGLTPETLAQVGEALFGALDAEDPLGELVAALALLPPVEIALTAPSLGLSLLQVEGRLGDLATPRKVQLTLDGSAGADRFEGWAGDDTAHGAGGRDRLSGNAGDDWLEGGRGNDLLRGGAGADLFRFGRGGDRDVVADFGSGADRLELDEGLWRAEGLTARQVVARFAEVTDDGVRFDFGARGELLLAGLDTTRGLAAQIDLA